ncbi:electron transfer flavoprotein subunit beta/FixA family protein [Candidatus Methylacidiphilum fumarolicum]|uniref:Protein fixA n=2 Tax=Candidatus Methylacidiphilum fumarolicum TaxID=591154 RepID=I0JYP8_METFB|nr:electron transfer flavoprotein subunit beta/FixA family protein [Candidatus Methylacidiphilum fumarolicum]MBW6415079.1 electron transfer flavoprotein subunit beta/FixA family protein [Candidatus Methylacidiphilum fumarolicum]TFE69690.1 nitrogen fixation protein FixA [Candidatus Methylacidiphilum fumarolicum]TFE74845.1 electron transfer flavoprotein subunit beta/FixA family protein [Candidatus Methylacidiphilum fumarolicum]TFE75490.1 electron transfer flavoprotein subunit beta/FixA family pro
MHVVILVKQVPDSSQIRVHPQTGTIMRQGVPAILNPYDLFALEKALELKDVYGSFLTVLSMGPLQAEAALRKALSYGADEAILLSDRAFAGSDTLATSYALAAALRKIDSYRKIDIVFAGKQTIDGDTGQVGPGVARRLGLQLLTYVQEIKHIDYEKKKVLVHRKSEKGIQVVSSQLPCLMTILDGNSSIRYASLPNMIRAAKAPVKIWNRMDAGIEDISKIGLKGSPTVVGKVFAPQNTRGPAEMIEGDEPELLCSILIEKLFEKYPEVEKEVLQQVR